jgi:hypothetical protein
MPSENLELVRSIYADWERGDYSSTEWAHPGIEFVGVGGPDPGSSTGLAGLAKLNRDFRSAWTDFASRRWIIGNSTPSAFSF